MYLFKVALKSDDSSSKKKAQEKNDVVETSTAPPKKMSSSTINTKEIISQRNMEKNLPSTGRSTARLNRSDTHRIDMNLLSLTKNTFNISMLRKISTGTKPKICVDLFHHDWSKY